MGTILEGGPVVQSIIEDIAERIRRLNEKKVKPSLLLIRVGNRPDDVSYEKSIVKRCAENGINALTDPISVDATIGEIKEHIKRANEDSEIHGIMIFRPLPQGLNEEDISAVINPQKDVDCISSINIGKVFEGKETFYPCTAQAVLTMLKYYEIPISGANVVVIGRSLVIGKPVAMMLLNENATVTMCHSKTERLQGVTKNADIVIAAIGQASYLTRKYFSQKSQVIDVGINFDEKGKLHGDVDFESVRYVAKSITPFRGGVGIVTTMTLLQNTVTACERQTK